MKALNALRLPLLAAVALAAIAVGTTTVQADARRTTCV